MIDLPLAMSAAQFGRLVGREHERVELKTGAGRKPMQETLVAFSNAEGGVILIGVRDDRTVIGRRRDQGLDDDIHGAANDAVSIGRYSIREVTVDGRPVVAVVVQPRTDDVAQTSDGRVLVRKGGHNRPLFGRDLLALLNARSLIRYEAADSGVSLDRVDREARDSVAKAFGLHVDEVTAARWAERGLLHDSGRLTIAGALTLTDPTKTLGAAKFHVDVRTYDDDRTASYVHRKTITGPVQSQVQAATDLVIDRVGTAMVVTGARRHDVPRLPRRVVREAVANAVAHRSYEFDASPVVVEVRPGVVVVRSPGRLPPPVTVETLRQAQAPRNHTVIDVLRRFGLAEDSGQGIDVIQDGMRLELLEEPVFTETEDSFVVELPTRGLVSTEERAWLMEYEQTGRLHPMERSLLLVALREGRVNNMRARDALGVDSTEARAVLRRLRDVGLLEQHGLRGGAYYTLGSLGPSRSSQQVVLAAAAEGPVTNARVRELTGLDRVAARSLLRRLVVEGFLTQHGERRGTTYVLAKRTRGRR